MSKTEALLAYLSVGLAVWLWLAAGAGGRAKHAKLREGRARGCAVACIVVAVVAVTWPLVVGLAVMLAKRLAKGARA